MTISDDKPFDDEMLHKAIAGAHVPALLMMLVHLTGDMSLLTPVRRPKVTDFASLDTGIPLQEQELIRAQAERELAAFLKSPSQQLPRLGDGDLMAMMQFIAAGEIPEDYIPFLKSELGVEAIDPRRPDWTANALAPDEPAPDAVVIGAGMSGILAGIRLQQIGVPFTILEKNDDVGGTWLENTYPGCRVDSDNQLYAYSFAPNPAWTHWFSAQPVILDYFRDITARFGLADRIQFGAEVTDAVFDETACLWRVTYQRAGQSETLSARFLISATGQLNKPFTPDIEGQALFTGQSFHSARWRHDIDLRGKRVAVVGTGASAFQIVPEIAPDVSSLTIYQRNPPWLIPTPRYHDEVPVQERWLLKNAPFYGSWYRFFLFWLFVDGFHVYAKVDPAWDSTGHGVSKINEDIRKLFLDATHAQLDDRPDLKSAVTPTYPFAGKRSLRDNGVWIQALKRANVHLVTSAIEKIDATGIVSADGCPHPVDVIIYCTGFRASEFLSPMKIVGREGADLRRLWGADARAYLGMTIPQFPNFFCIYGPNTNLVVNGSIISFSEAAVNYVVQAIRWVVTQRVGAVDVRPEVFWTYNGTIDAENRAMAWGLDGISSWYKSSSGRVSQNWPLKTVDYWKATWNFEPGDYVAISCAMSRLPAPMT